MVSRITSLFGRSREGNECDHVRGLSSDFIDDELDPEERDRLLAHLEWCGLCIAFINTLRATVNMLGSSDAPETPPALKDNIRARITQDDRA